MLIDKLHALLAKIGVSPKVADPFLAAVALAVAQLITEGTLDVDGLKLAAAGLVLALIGVAAPPSAGLNQRAVDKLGRK